MGAIFSHHHRHHNKKKPPPKVHVTDHDRAVLDLKTAKDRLKRYQVKVSHCQSTKTRCRFDDQTDSQIHTLPNRCARSRRG